MKNNVIIRCANCWGVQAYEGKVYDIPVDRNREIISRRERDSFIRRFVTRFINGITPVTRRTNV